MKTELFKSSRVLQGFFSIPRRYLEIMSNQQGFYPILIFVCTSAKIELVIVCILMMHCHDFKIKHIGTVQFQL
jgi:hypothetical protein